MQVTILFGDRRKKSAPDQIAAQARLIVNSALRRIGQMGQCAIPARPVWHSVAMQIDCGKESEFRALLDAIHGHCQPGCVEVMGVRCS